MPKTKRQLTEAEKAQYTVEFTALQTKHGMFYAFGNEQLQEQIREGKTKEDYTSIFECGDVILKENVKPFISDIKELQNKFGI